MKTAQYSDALLGSTFLCLFVTKSLHENFGLGMELSYQYNHPKIESVLVEKNQQ